MQNIDFSFFSYRASFMGSPVGSGCSEIIALPMGAVVGPYYLFDLNCHLDCLLFPRVDPIILILIKDPQALPVLQL